MNTIKIVDSLLHALQVTEKTKFLKLHAKELEIDSTSVELSGGEGGFFARHSPVVIFVFFSAERTGHQN